jgi:hypothetical protein
MINSGFSMIKFVFDRACLHDQGKGSNPPLEKGWQRRILFEDRKIPFRMPYFSIA